MTWTWLREPSPPDDPVADCVSLALISCLTYFMSAMAQRVMYQTCLRHRRPSEEEDRKQRKENAPWMYHVYYSCHKCCKDTNRRQ